ncbi:MAG: hypothetical protein JWM80_909 [Cyanobacteria bacterium RYN_339]|nr:hypothetical protein [Cyanobacteria bacterium RYN_339]
MGMTKLLLVLALAASSLHHMTWTERLAVHRAVADHLKSEHSPVKEFSVIQADAMGAYVRARIQPLPIGKTDPATAILKRDKGSWKVLVLGTMLGAETLKHYGVPKELGGQP